MIGSLCVECGPNVRVDEDGCCSSCGNGAMGTWLFEVNEGAPLEMLPGIDEEFAKYRKERM